MGSYGLGKHWRRSNIQPRDRLGLLLLLRVKIASDFQNNSVALLDCRLEEYPFNRYVTMGCQVFSPTSKRSRCMEDVER
eukprot:scaffold247493_cov29-Prasinocladus_malaysianus.AAC.1